MNKENFKKVFDNFLTSGFSFSHKQSDLKSHYEIVNIIIIMSILGLLYGAVGNIFRDLVWLAGVEAVLIVGGFVMLLFMRHSKKNFAPIVQLLSLEYTLFFLFLIYWGNPNDLKHVWIFTYPIIIFYLQPPREATFWLSGLLGALLVAPLQNFIDVSYSFYQLSYIAFVLFLVSVITHFYNYKMHRARDLIVTQQEQLKAFNLELEHQVTKQTSELLEMNEDLEKKVQEKIERLIQQEKLLTTQSKQAVMGEMISMIAHQWRQPLSSVTLRISNLQLKRLLGEAISDKEVEETLSNINETVVYLAQTIDDFQTYFRPNKEKQNIEAQELIRKVVTFIRPRLKETYIELVILETESFRFQTYINEAVQVLLNLLNNAVDALISSKKGFKRLTIALEKRAGKIHIFISDTADGIEKENIAHIFEPYFSTKGKNGTGLGLYMSQMIMQKQFGSEIKVQSSPEGTTFELIFPQ